MRFRLPSRAAVRGFVRRFRIPVRLRITRGGGFFAAGALAIGLAAINTGSNLLYLLVGAMMGFIAVSGWLSEQVIWGVEVEALPPRGVTAGTPARLAYELHNRTRRTPAYAVELVADGARTFAPVVLPAHDLVVRVRRTFPRRGVYPLERVTLATSFPFGLFVKERTVKVRGEVVVWPRRDRAVRDVTAARKGRRPRAVAEGGAPGARGEFRGLREYRPGDDPRDVHWRSSARLGQPLVRVYDRDTAPSAWICLDLNGPEDPAAEVLVEGAAALADRAVTRGERVALVTSDITIPPGQGPAHLEGVLDALARARFRPGAPSPRPPVDPQRCVLLTRGRGDRFGDVLTPEEL